MLIVVRCFVVLGVFALQRNDACATLQNPLNDSTVNFQCVCVSVSIGAVFFMGTIGKRSMRTAHSLEFAVSSLFAFPVEELPGASNVFGDDL